MIDPYDLTKPWDKVRLQEWFLFGVCVAGKSARQTAAKVEAMLEDMRVQYDNIGFPLMFTHSAPFASIETAIKRGKLGYYLRKFKLGQYKRINKAFRGMVKIDPATVTLEELEQIHGVGAKTAFAIPHAHSIVPQFSRTLENACQNDWIASSVGRI